MNNETAKAKPKFLSSSHDNFLNTVRHRVDEYFKKNNLSRHATTTLHFKVALHYIIAVLLYISIIAELFPPLVLLAMAMSLGVISGYIGINLCHDSLHGAYSSNSKINQLLGYAYDVVGLSSFVWKTTHNKGHHIYTNIAGVDPDLHKPVLLRLTPTDKHYPFHRWQHLYIWVLYSLVGLNWIYYSDYVCIAKEWHKVTIRERVLFFLFKFVNFAIFVAFPLYFMTLPWWQIAIGYLGYQMAGGFSVALIFQLAHLVERLHFPTPNAEGIIDKDWGDHEMYTTANFATNNHFLSYVLGGLNFQIEHHLMPYISHIHYKTISPIVKDTALEFGLPYFENSTFCGAVASHWRLLKKLGSPTYHGENYDNS